MYLGLSCCVSEIFINSKIVNEVRNENLNNCQGSVVSLYLYFQKCKLKLKLE